MVACIGMPSSFPSNSISCESKPLRDTWDIGQRGHIGYTVTGCVTHFATSGAITTCLTISFAVVVRLMSGFLGSALFNEGFPNIFNRKRGKQHSHSNSRNSAFSRRLLVQGVHAFVAAVGHCHLSSYLQYQCLKRLWAWWDATIKPQSCSCASVSSRTLYIASWGCQCDVQGEQIWRNTSYINCLIISSIEKLHFVACAY